MGAFLMNQVPPFVVQVNTGSMWMLLEHPVRRVKQSDFVAIIKEFHFGRRRAVWMTKLSFKESFSLTPTPLTKPRSQGLSFSL